MVERFGDGVSSCLLLQVVVADAGGNGKSFLDVSIFKRIEHCVVPVCPDACVEVGLQFEADANLVAFGFAYAAHLFVSIAKSAKQILNIRRVMPGAGVVGTIWS